MQHRIYQPKACMSANSISEKFEQVLESFGPNTSYVWDVLQQYIDDPNSVNETWQQLFAEVVASGSVDLPQKSSSKKSQSQQPVP
jgi:2-oxoglutarate dehydrogenase complex dehydrogenase (E1) component-like enzyme